MTEKCCAETEKPAIQMPLASSSSDENFKGVKKSVTATCVIVLGMAGSGKTTFIQRLNCFLHQRKSPPYIVNLDPAVSEVPYPVNVDIRDTVKYKDVMREYGLGPNGAIVTSLNLFATKFDQVLTLLDKRSKEYEYILVDTPGQIEVFTWSASGAIISESLASQMPTVIVYVMDTKRNTSPVTFMSNMLYACSILYKTKLPFVIVMNKIDIVHHSFALSWMRDFTAFHDALQQEKSYISNLSMSMSLVLEEFYQHIRCAGVSSLEGTGFDELLEQLSGATEEYETTYKPEIEKLQKAKTDAQLKRQQAEMEKFQADYAKSNSAAAGINERPTSNDMT